MSTNYNATAAAASATGGTRLDASASNGVLRVFTSTYTKQAGEGLVADTITWGTIPAGAQIIGSLSNLNCADGTAATTLNLGTADDATAYLAASSVADPAVHALTAINADGAVVVTTEPTTLVSVVAGDTLLTGQVITLRIVYVQN